MHIPNERLSLLYVSLAMVTVGMLIAETGASLALLVHQLNLTEAQQGSIISARFLGGVAFGLFLWVRAASVPLGRWFQGALVLTIATVPLLFVQTFSGAYVAALLRGLTAGFVIPAAGMYATSQHRWPVGMISGIVNAALSGGLVLVSVAAFSISNGPWARWEIYWGMAPVVAVATFVVGYLGGASIPSSVLPTEPGLGDESQDPSQNSTDSETEFLDDTPSVSIPDTATATLRTEDVPSPENPSLRSAAVGQETWMGPPRDGKAPHVVDRVFPLTSMLRLLSATAAPFAAAAFFIVGTEAILFGLMPRLSALLVEERAAAAGGAWIWVTEQYALAVMVGVFVGRVSGSFVLRVVRPSVVLLVSVTSLLLFGLLWIFASPPLIALSTFGFGLATANFFPALVGAVAVALRDQAPTTIAAMGWTGAGGGTLVPPVAALALAAGLPYPLMGLLAPLPSLVAVVLSVRAVSVFRHSSHLVTDSDHSFR